MKKIYQALGIGALALGIASTAYAEETLKGKPVSVAGEEGFLSIIIEKDNPYFNKELRTKDNKAYDEKLIISLPSYGTYKYNRKLTTLKALVLAEIYDGDDETIEVYGKFEKGVFKPDHVIVEDYHFNVDKDKKDNEPWRMPRG